MSLRLSLGDRDRLGLQDESSHYANASRTIARLRMMCESSKLAAEPAPRQVEIEAPLQSGEAPSASASNYNP